MPSLRDRRVLHSGCGRRNVNCPLTGMSSSSSNKAFAPSPVQLSTSFSDNAWIAARSGSSRTLQPVDDGGRQGDTVVGETVVAVEGHAADLTLALSADRVGQ